MQPIPLSLPPLPVVQAQAVALLSDPDAEPKDLAEAVSLDPSLSAAVLRAANSASSAPISPVTSVDVAVVRMGTSEIRRIVAAGVLGGSFSGLQEANIDSDEVWRYVIVTASITEHVAPDALARPAFTAGVLHDVGRLVMIATQPQAYAEVVAMVHEGADARYAETQVFGVDHAQWGAEVAEVWRFAPMLVEAIAQHHEGGHPLADAVRHASQLTAALGIGDGVQPVYEATLDLQSPQGGVIVRLGGEEGLRERVAWFRGALSSAA